MKKRKLNALDIIVIVAIIAIVGVVIYKFAVVDNESGLGVKQAYKDAEYVLMVSNIREMTVNGFNVGDKIFEEKKGTLMGTIKDIKFEPYKTIEITNAGEGVEAEKIGYYTAYLTIVGPVVDKGNGYFLSGNLDLKINSEYDTITKLVKTTGKVTSITIKE